MTEVRAPVDLETVVVAALEQAPAFDALLGPAGSARPIATRLPAGFTASRAVKVARVGGGPVGWPDHVDRAVIGFDAYGADDLDAWAVAAALVVAVAALEGSIVAGGVVTAVDRVLGPLFSPDPDADEAPRYLLQYAVTAHPAPPPPGP